MKPIVDFLDRHPFALGGIGTVSGIAAGAAKALHIAAGVAADIGMLCSASTAVMGLVIVVRKWRRDRWERKAESAWVARREPYEDHLP